MTAIVTQGDARHLLFPDASVDLVMTSPPYFGLRSYTDGGAHYEGQVGDEASPAEYLDALIACTAEWVRVLKPGGSIFVNLGDKYAGAPSGPRTPMDDGYTRDYEKREFQSRRRMQQAAPPKSLQGLPWRYAIRCMDQLGLILRAEIVWSKPNGLPESVTDRVRRSHEVVFHFVTQPRYYASVDEVREEYAPASIKAYARGGLSTSVGEGYHPSKGTRMRLDGEEDAWRGNPLGKLPGSVWEIATAPLTVPEHLGVDHFAAYPPELVRRIVAGWSPREVCTACGEGRRPVTVAGDYLPAGHGQRDASVLRRRVPGEGRDPLTRHGEAASTLRTAATRSVAGYACACPDTAAPTTPGVILDPFMGTGTTVMVASVLGRVGIGVDLSWDYVRLARWRTTDPNERARALGVPKPPPQVDGQLGMFDGLGA